MLFIYDKKTKELIGGPSTDPLKVHERVTVDEYLENNVHRITDLVIIDGTTLTPKTSVSISLHDQNGVKINMGMK